MPDQEVTPNQPNIEQVNVLAQIETLNKAVSDLRASDAQLDERLTTAIENMVEIIKDLLERVETLEQNTSN